MNDRFKWVGYNNSLQMLGMSKKCFDNPKECFNDMYKAFLERMGVIVGSDSVFDSNQDFLNYQIHISAMGIICSYEDEVMIYEIAYAEDEIGVRDVFTNEFISYIDNNNLMSTSQIKKMDEMVPYPCLECPFNSYSKKK